MSTLPSSPPASISARHGRHRCPTTRSRALEIGEITGRVGSIVTLAALLVVAGAVGGAFDGMPAGQTTTVTLSEPGR